MRARRKEIPLNTRSSTPGATYRCTLLLGLLAMFASAPQVAQADGVVERNAVDARELVTTLCAFLLDARAPDDAATLLDSVDLRASLPTVEAGVCAPRGGLSLRQELLLLAAVSSRGSGDTAGGPLLTEALSLNQDASQAANSIALLEAAHAPPELLSRSRWLAAERFTTDVELQRQRMLDTLRDDHGDDARRSIQHWLAAHIDQTPDFGALPSGYLETLAPPDHRAAVHDLFFRHGWRSPAFTLRRARAHADAYIASEDESARQQAIAAYRALSGWYTRHEELDLRHLRALDAWDLALAVALQRCSASEANGEAERRDNAERRDSYENCDDAELLDLAFRGALSEPLFSRSRALQRQVERAESLASAQASFIRAIDRFLDPEDLSSALARLQERFGREEPQDEDFAATLLLLRKLRVQRLLAQEARDLLNDMLLPELMDHIVSGFQRGNVVTVGMLADGLLRELAGYHLYARCEEVAATTLQRLSAAEISTPNRFGSIVGYWLTCREEHGTPTDADDVRALVPNQLALRRATFYRLLEAGHCEVLDELLDDEEEVTGTDPELLLFDGLCRISASGPESAHASFAAAYDAVRRGNYPDGTGEHLLDIAIGALRSADTEGEFRAALQADRSALRAELTLLRSRRLSDWPTRPDRRNGLWGQELDTADEHRLVASPFIDVLAVRALSGEEAIDSEFSRGMLNLWSEHARGAPVFSEAIELPFTWSEGPGEAPSPARAPSPGCASDSLRDALNREGDTPDGQRAKGQLILACARAGRGSSATWNELMTLSLQHGMSELAYRLGARAIDEGADVASVGRRWLQSFAATRNEGLGFEPDQELLRRVIRALAAPELASLLCPESELRDTLRQGITRWRHFDATLREIATVGCDAGAGAALAATATHVSVDGQRIALAALTSMEMQTAFLQNFDVTQIRLGALETYFELAARNGRYDLLATAAGLLGPPTPEGALLQLRAFELLRDGRHPYADELGRSLRRGGYQGADSR